MTKQQLKRKYYSKNFDCCWYTGSNGKCEHYLKERRIKKLFKKWLKENIHRFTYKPYSKNKQYKEFYFEGIAKNITLVMNHSNAEAMLFYENPIDDMYCCDHSVIAYIGCADHDPENGYYDSDRVDEVYTYYSTKEEVVIKESFEHIIPFVNEKFVKENILSIWEGSWIVSSIMPKTKYEKERDEILLIESDKRHKTDRRDKTEWFTFDIFSGELLEKLVFSDTAI
jgi:hypothetical protein